MTDITGWIVVLHGSRNLIGEPRATSLNADGVRTMGMCPVYELVRMPAPDGRGIVQIVHPVNWHPVERLSLPLDAIVYSVDDLPSDEKRGLRQSVTKAEQILQQMKTGGSAVSVVPSLGAVGLK